MTVLYHEEPQNSLKKCKLLLACLKDPCSDCHVISGRIAKPEEEQPTSDIDDDEAVISAIRSGALEKLRKKPTMLMSDSFSWVYSPETKELYIKPKELDQIKDSVKGFEECEEFLSVKSCFSCCSSAASRDAFVSAKTSFSRSSSSLNDGGYLVDLNELHRRSIIREFCHCEGWPFGLCRKAVLLPPLPKSPSEPWLWRKDNKILKLTF